MAKKKKRGRPVKEFCIYYFEILDYEPSYNIGVDHLKDINPDPISERSELKIIGKMLDHPKLSGRIVNLIFFGSRHRKYALEHPEEVSRDIDRVGELEIRGKHAEFVGHVPIDCMAFLSSNLHAGKIKYIDLFSEPLHYGKAKVTSFHFYEKQIEDEEEIT